jgi:heme/copper-type cytochrome/quinol oxidase subunit 2
LSTTKVIATNPTEHAIHENWGIFVDYWVVMGFLCLVYGLQLYCCFFVRDEKLKDPKSWWRFL